MATRAIDNALLAQLRARNIRTVTVSYSGGNDDGGCDTVSALTADGERIDLNTGYVGETGGAGWEKDKDGKEFPAGVKVTHHWEPDSRHSYFERATEQEVTNYELVEDLCRPVNDRYGSWAGDFSAHGELTYDVERGQLTIDAYESSYTEVGVEF